MNIVQIGCNNGDDHVFDFINTNDITSAYLVEPLVYPYNLAVEKYKDFKNVTLFNMAITDDDSQNELELFTTPDCDKIRFEGASFNKSHVDIHTNRTDTTSIKVKCRTLNKFLEDVGVYNIDRLYIDTEGLDCRILNTVDFEKYNIKRIQFEYIHSGNVLDWGNSEILTTLKNKLISFGYTVNYIDKFDMIAERI
jgi:FkbM family methyltransferase